MGLHVILLDSLSPIRIIISQSTLPSNNHRGNCRYIITLLHFKMFQIIIKLNLFYSYTFSYILFNLVVQIDMSSGAYLATGFMYINMGSHMIFILKNRLEAQGISDEKISKILCNLINSIFKSHFMMTIMIPQQPMALQTLKEVFRRLAHSSTMKLDPSSMQKLLCLIIMTVKKQLFLLSSPYELFAVTSGNLQILVNYTKDTQTYMSMLSVSNCFHTIASNYRFIQFVQLRQYLLSILEPIQTKVVNFYESKDQNEMGRLIFSIRNTHNDKPIGTGINHKTIQLSTSIITKKKYLPFQSWLNWNSSLVINHAENYARQTQQRNLKRDKQQESNQKSINDLFKFQIDEDNDFQVKFQFLSYDDEPNTSTKDNKSKKQIKTANTKQNSLILPQKQQNIKPQSKIKQKIYSQFDVVNNQAENEDDLLDLMDN